MLFFVLLQYYFRNYCQMLYLSYTDLYKMHNLVVFINETWFSEFCSFYILIQLKIYSQVITKFYLAYSGDRTTVPLLLVWTLYRATSPARTFAYHNRQMTMFAASYALRFHPINIISNFWIFFHAIICDI